MLSNMTDNYSQRGIENMMRTIFSYTIIAEAAGMLLILTGFILDGYPLIDSLWHSLFHSVSAFCNAGMSTLPSSLVHAGSLTKISVACMIILGGIGMYVVYDIGQSALKHRKMRINTKIILITSFVLIVTGALLIKFYQTRSGINLSWIDAFFQSISARTAGFNSVDLKSFVPGSILVMLVLMLIGGAPGSTAGGMKVTTFAVVMAALWNTFSGNEKVLMFKREIAMSTVLRAFAIAVTFIVLSGIGAGIFQGLTKVDMQKAYFEVVSALGTVGMSLGIGDNYTDKSKLFIILYMFIGRIGPLTLLVFLFDRKKKSKLVYPEEKVIIG